MIVLDKPYALGYQSLLAMVVGSLKYPALTGGGLFLTRMLISLLAGKTLVAQFLLGKPYHTMFFFVCMLALFFALSVLPEYFGFSLMLGEKALYVRSGILSHQVTAVAYREVANVVIIPSRTLFFMKDFVVHWHRHGKDEELVFPCLSRRMRTELFDFLTQ